MASSTDGQEEDEHEDKEDEVERPPVYPLRVTDASRTKRMQEMGAQSGDSWSATSVLSGLWPFKTSGTNHEEMDGEIVMTV